MEFPAKTSLSLMPNRVKPTALAVAKEVGDGATHRARVAFNEWMRAELMPFIDQEVQRIATLFASEVAAYQRDLDQIRSRITDEDVESPIASEIVDELMTAFSSGVGLSTDFGAGLGHLMQQLVAVAALAVVWFFTPVGWISLVVAPFLLGTLNETASAKLLNKIRTSVADDLNRSIQGHTQTGAQAVSDAFYDQMTPGVTSIVSRMKGQLDEMRNSVEATLALRGQSQARIASERETLKALEARTKKADSDLDDLINEVVLL